ncbi:hypothetical protein VTO73DRAFT_3206 [Trametes versicolor]
MPEKAARDKPATNALPRRAAARKASKLAAEQLESSPIPSDAENDGGVSFGEPSTPRGTNVKVTYGGKRKYKLSPVAKTSPAAQAGPSRTRPRSQSLLEISPKKPKGTAGRGRGAPRGRGARKTTRNIRARSASTTSSSSESSAGHSSDLIEYAPKAPSTRRAVAAAPDHTKPAPKAGTTNGNGNGAASTVGDKKRPLSISSSDSEGSVLTPLHSPEMNKMNKSPAVRQMPVLAPRLARQFMRSQSQADALKGSGKKSVLKQSKSFDHLFKLDSSSEEDSPDDLDIGSLVWVSIDLEGNLMDCDEDEADTIWWPAKVYLPRPCMRVVFLGEPPGRADTGPRQLTIPDPSPSNVRSMVQNGRIRFRETDCRPARRPSAQSSPRKKRKTDVDAAWREARDLMLREEQAQNGGGPSVLLSSDAPPSSKGARRKLNAFPSLDIPAGKGKGKGKGKAKRKGSESEVSLSDSDDNASPESWKHTWRAPSANPLLEIPGELVLAREGRARTQYWPAKLLEYLKPKSEKQRPRYRALFFDGTVLQIEPDWFWTTADDEFGTCKMGQSTGNYGLDSDVDTDDDEETPEDFNHPFTAKDEKALRAPSPLPELPPPAPEVFEYDLELTEQFDYVKPVLAAVIEGTYGPSQAAHEGFMRGAGARQKVLNTVPLRGSLSARDKEEVAYLVRAWARRRERRRELGVSVDYPPEKLYPPVRDSAGEAKTRAAGDKEANGHGGGDHDESDAESVLTPTSDASGGDTEPLVFETEPPSSSLAATEVETDDDEQARIVDGVAGEVAHAGSAGDVPAANLPSENPTTHTDAHESPEDATAAAGNETRAPPRTTFHDLDTVEKLTYCNNVLLQEAILQLLLWRTGQRTALGLLSPAEERRLHDLAMEEGEKTNWVHDIIRLRQAAEQSMLPTHAAKGKEKAKAAEPAPGGRARTRRAA